MEYAFHQLSAIIILLVIIASTLLFGARTTKIYLGVILVVLICAATGEMLVPSNGVVIGAALGLAASAIFGVLAKPRRLDRRNSVGNEV